MPTVELTDEEIATLIRIADRLRAGGLTTPVGFDASELVTVEQLAKECGVSVFTIRRRANKRRDPLFKARSMVASGRRMLFLRSKLNRLEREGGDLQFRLTH